MSPRILVVSARMGAGHDGAAKELSRRLEAAGCRTRLVDFLDACPKIGRLLHFLYHLQLRAAPWSYEATYRIWFLAPLLCRPMVAVLSMLFGRRMRRWARELDAHAVVSTYPLASVVLGHERRRLGVPVATYLTDFAVHPLWVHPKVDLHLCVHPQSARQVGFEAATPSRAPGPLVSAKFLTGLPRRSTARLSLGLPDEAKVALLVAGSWGVGELEEAFDEIARSGSYLPIAVCGSNEELRRRLEERETGRILGWTDEMPELMAASDVLVQNGGGLTCMEAFAAGLPVVSFRPIPGHGRQNAIDMERAGVAAFAHDSESLEAVLDRVTTLAGRQMTGRGRAMFAGDAADDVLELASTAAVSMEDAGAFSGRFSKARPRRAVTVAAAAIVAYATVNVGAFAATASGVGTAHPASNTRATYVAVRLGPGNMADPELPALLAAHHTTAIVEGDLALRHRVALRRLSAAGVDLANGGWGGGDGLHLMGMEDGVVRARQVISTATHRRCPDFAPDIAVNGFDLVAAHLQHERVVHASLVLVPGHVPRRLVPRTIYVLDAERSTTGQLNATLQELGSTLVGTHVSNEPLATLH